MGPPQPLSIPWRAVAAWGEHHGLDRDELALLRQCLAAMDAVYRTWCAEKAKKTEDK